MGRLDTHVLSVEIPSLSKRTQFSTRHEVVQGQALTAIRDKGLDMLHMSLNADWYYGGITYIQDALSAYSKTTTLAGTL